jgi:hypothetical protein
MDMEGLAFDVKTNFIVRLFRIDLKGRSADSGSAFRRIPAEKQIGETNR